MEGFLKKLAKILGVARENLPVFLGVLTLGVVAQVSLIFPSGLFYRGGFRFWGAQAHDGLWHVSLIQKLKYLSFENPVFAGERIGSYHYLSNLIIALVHRISGISVFNLFFRIFPSLISFSIGVLTFKLAKKLFRTEAGAIWSMFFVFMGSNFAYILPLFGLGYEILESAFWVQQPISMFTNMPFSASVPLILGALYFLDSYLSKGDKTDLVFSSVLFSLLAPTKSFSIVFNLAFGLAGGIRLILKRRTDLIIASILSLLFGFLLMLPAFKFERHLIFEPGWFLRTMIEAPDRMNWQDQALKLQVYRENFDIFNLSKFYLMAFLIFLFGNLGTRAVMFFGIVKRDFFKNEVHQILVCSLFLTLFIPIFFLTTGIVWNSIQFMYYFLLVAGIYAGYGTCRLMSRIKEPTIRVFASLVIILLTIPTSLHTLWFYHHRGPDTKVEGAELEALTKLSKSGSFRDTILTYPLEQSFIEVSAFSGKSTFLGDWLMAVVPGHDYAYRLESIRDASRNKDKFLDFLRVNKISWIYIKGIEPEIVKEIEENLNLFYCGGDITIYRVEKI